MSPNTEPPIQDPSSTDGTGTSPLEVKYRRLLRVLPRAYRDANQAAMLATFIENAEESDPENADLTLTFGTVGVAETVSVLGLAARLRWAEPHAPERFRTRFAGLRFFTLAGLAISAGLGLLFLAGSLMIVISPPLESATGPLLDVLFPTADGWWWLLRVWVVVFWIPALIFAIAGTRRSIKAALTCTAVPTAVSLATPIVTALGHGLVGFHWNGWAAAAVDVAILAGLRAMLVSPGRLTPRSRRMWLLAPWCLALAYAAVMTVLWQVLPRRPWGALEAVMFSEPGFWCLATLFLVAASVLTARRASLRSATQYFGLATIAVAATVRCAATLPTWIGYVAYQGVDGAAAMLAAALTQLAAVVAVAIGAGAITARRIHRMPHPAASDYEIPA